MARHARASTPRRLWAAAGRRLSAWAERVAVARPRGRHAKAAPRAGGHDRRLILAAGAAALMVYGVLLFRGQPLGPGSTHPPAASAGSRRNGAAGHGHAPKTIRVVTQGSVPDAQPTPPPVLATGTVASEAAAAPGHSGASASSHGSAPPRPSPAPATANAAQPAAAKTSSTKKGSNAPPGKAPTASEATAHKGSTSPTGGPRPPASASPSTAPSATAQAVRVAATLQAAVPDIRPPVQGTVLAGFGWAYSSVFADWQEHTGVDLSAPVGAVVVAPGSGVVLAVRHDTLWGWVVSLALPGGYSTNLSALGSVSVKPNDRVRAGATLGKVGTPPPAESNLASHVFWQVFKGTDPINPLA